MLKRIEMNTNTYAKYAPNVFLAKCPDEHQKGDTIYVTTKYGKENECIVHNLILQRDGFFYYSITRADGFNAQEHAKNKAERLNGYAATAERKSNEYYEASNEGSDFLSLGEPIKIGHHSEKRHRALIERNAARMDKSVAFDKKKSEYEYRAGYWEGRADIVNLSMPESIEYYEHKLQKAKAEHEGLKNGTIKRRHSYSLTYAKKEVNDLSKNLDLAKKLWA